MSADLSRTNRIVLEQTRELFIDCIAEIDAALAASVGAPQPEIIEPNAQDRSAFARAAGFTGDICRLCSGTSMFRAGSCLTCADCGATTGCS